MYIYKCIWIYIQEYMHIYTLIYISIYKYVIYIYVYAYAVSDLSLVSYKEEIDTLEMPRVYQLVTMNRSYIAYHIRRGDFQQKHTRLESKVLHYALGRYCTHVLLSFT
jgi:hypothetical protein